MNGTGRVQYAGSAGRLQTLTKKSGTVPPAKVLQILKLLDQAKFTTLDSRAFVLALDTPTVGVRASMDGGIKHVRSDAAYYGYAQGQQARFVDATREIDKILASTTWLSCEGACEDSLPQ